MNTFTLAHVKHPVASPPALPSLNAKNYEDYDKPYRWKNPEASQRKQNRSRAIHFLTRLQGTYVSVDLFWFQVVLQTIKSFCNQNSSYDEVYGQPQPYWNWKWVKTNGTTWVRCKRLWNIHLICLKTNSHFFWLDKNTVLIQEGRWRENTCSFLSTRAPEESFLPKSAC